MFLYLGPVVKERSSKRKNQAAFWMLEKLQEEQDHFSKILKSSTAVKSSAENEFGNVKLKFSHRACREKLKQFFLKIFVRN